MTTPTSVTPFHISTMGMYLWRQPSIYYSKLTNRVTVTTRCPVTCHLYLYVSLPLWYDYLLLQNGFTCGGINAIFIFFSRLLLREEFWETLLLPSELDCVCVSCGSILLPAGLSHYWVLIESGVRKAVDIQLSHDHLTCVQLVKGAKGGVKGVGWMKKEFADKANKRYHSTEHYTWKSTVNVYNV